jgi:hypothetical protein|nr:MAG TPA: hypothetical protein [Bacteriophage sp.]
MAINNEKDVQQDAIRAKVRRGFTFANMGGRNGLTVLNNNLSRLTEKFEEITKLPLKDAEVKVDFFPIDATNTRLGLDTMLVTFSYRNGFSLKPQKDGEQKPKEYVQPNTGVYALILSSSGDTVGAEEVIVDNRQYTINRYPTEATVDPEITKDFLAYAAQRLGLNTDGKFDTVIYAGGASLYTDRTNIENTDEVTNVLINAITAAQTAIDSQPLPVAPFVDDINLADHNRSEDSRSFEEVEQLEIERKLLNGVAVDPHGNIIRADWGVNLISRINRNSNGYGLGSAANPVIKTTGYTDIVMFNPAISEKQDYWNRTIRDTPDGKQILAPVHVFTSIVPTYSRSKGNFLYGLAVAATAIRYDYWDFKAILNPAEHPADDPHSVAGLGFEVANLLDTEFAPFPTPANTPDYNDRIWENLIGDIWSKRCSFAIEAAVGTPYYWIVRDFVLAAYESDMDIRSPESHTGRILTVANHLTNGRMAEMVNGDLIGRRVCFALDGQQFVAGNYTNSAGELRSLQDFDRRFLDNTVKKVEDLEYTNAWVRATSGLDIAADVRVSTQLDIIYGLYAHANVTGYGPRINLEENFMAMLQQAVSEIGPVVDNRSHYENRSDAQFNTYLGDAMFENFNTTMLRAGGSRTASRNGGHRRHSFF